jgi:hypothetical protein
MSLLFVHVAHPVFADQEDLEVTATVNPRQADLTLSLSGSVQNGATVSPGAEIQYTISYVSRSNSSFPLQIVATWEEGLVLGTESNYIAVFDYMGGTATTGKGGAEPIIDLIQRTITWNIPSVSASDTFREVSFKLKVKSSFVTTNSLSAYVRASGRYLSASLNSQSHQIIVQPPAVTPTPSPTPTGYPFSQFVFEAISLEHVDSTSALMTVTTSLDSTLQVSYGLCRNKVRDQTLTLDEISSFHEVWLTDLTPNTAYCVQISAISPGTGKTITSDIYVIKTAGAGQAITVSQTRTIWQNIQLDSSDVSHLVVPKNIPLVMIVEIESAGVVSQIDGVFINRSVLGVSTLVNRNVEQVSFIEIARGVFSAEIMSPSVRDEYLFALSITDSQGKYSRITIPHTYRVADRLRIRDQQDAPIENAKVRIERYEESRDRFVAFGDAFSFTEISEGFALPFYANADGEIPLALPLGSYRIQTSAIGHAPTVSEFVLDQQTNSYPIITLAHRGSFWTGIDWMTESVAMVLRTFFSDKSLYFRTHILFSAGLAFQMVIALIALLGIAMQLGIINRMGGKIGRVLRDLDRRLLEFFFGGWAILNLTVTVFFISERGWVSSLPYIGITFLIVVVDIAYLVVKELHSIANSPPETS